MLLKANVVVIMQPSQGGSITEGQPNSRICFVCGVKNPIGLHLAFYTGDQDRCTAGLSAAYYPE